MDSVLVVIPLLVIVPSSLMCPMPYAWFLASCSMGRHMFLLLFLDLAFPPLSLTSSLSGFFQDCCLLLGFCSPPFILGIFPLNLGIACQVMCTLG